MVNAYQPQYLNLAVTYFHTQIIRPTSWSFFKSALAISDTSYNHTNFINSSHFPHSKKLLEVLLE